MRGRPAEVSETVIPFAPSAKQRFSNDAGESGEKFKLR
jgi:hypothetical protein